MNLEQPCLSTIAVCNLALFCQTLNLYPSGVFFEHIPFLKRSIENSLVLDIGLAAPLTFPTSIYNNKEGCMVVSRQTKMVFIQPLHFITL